MKFHSLKTRFENWFRNLTKFQAMIFWITLIASAIVIMRNNPISGYTRTYTYIKNQTMQEACSRWDDEDPLKNYYKEYWEFEDSKTEDGWKDVTDPEELKKIEELFLAEKSSTQQSRVADQVTENIQRKYFYRKKNPWWWIYGYESDEYKKWQEYHWKEKPFFRFETLGGLLNFLVFVLIVTKIFMWIVGIRDITKKD